ncbi:MFS transporter [Aromatoleum toluvorans]|uniref:MFS transporter n=1 Tax=Aromatoleum toluvorans TaxID=92002 RepID=A0ABX1PV95_9RHOO|nr:MFS transporter [Aromatoleum toluvorans]NMG42416.1 MFS transporter [Aromatoleum toluvorans]
MKTLDSRTALALLAGCLASAQVGKVPPALAAIREQLGVGLIHAGWIATAINAAAAMLGVIVGLALARLGAERGLLAGLLLMGTGSALGAAAPDGMTLIASRACEGAGFVLVVVAAPSLLAAAAADDPARRRRLLTLWSCYMPTGMGLMMAVAPLLLQRYGWRGLWTANAVAVAACLLAAVLLHRRLAERAGPRPPPLQMFTRARLTQPAFWLMGVCFGSYAATWFMIATWLPSFAVEHMGYTAEHATWLTAVAVGGNILGNLTTGPLLARGVPRWTLLVGVMVMMGGLGWFVFTAGYDPVLRSVAAVVACSAGGLLPAAVMGGIPLHAHSPADIAIGNGILMQCSNLGTFVGVPAIAALATALGGWDGGRWLIPLLAGVGVAAAWTFRGIERRHDANSLTGSPAATLVEQT